MKRNIRKSNPDWTAANQAYLNAHIYRITELLRHAGSKNDYSGSEKEGIHRKNVKNNVIMAGESISSPSALDLICEKFNLSPFERDILLLCAGTELDVNFPALCAKAQGTPSRPFVTIGLALETLPEPHWDAFSPDGPLRKWRLIELESGDSMTSRSIRIPERILHYLLGITCSEELLSSILDFIPVMDSPPLSYLSLSEHISGILKQAKSYISLPLIQLYGQEGAEKRAIAAITASKMGYRLYGLHAAQIPAIPGEREYLAHLWGREAILENNSLLLEIAPDETLEVKRNALTFIKNIQGICFLICRDPITSTGIRLEVDKLNAGEQITLWKHHLGNYAGSLNSGIERIAAQFSLGAEEIRLVSENTHNKINHNKKDRKQRKYNRKEIQSLLWNRCRRQLRPAMQDLAQLIDTTAGWGDLVLPSIQLQTLHSIVVHVNQRQRVYEEWGFGKRGSRGLGISALFAGPSGTGKTLAAEVLANELDLDLYRIDLSSVVSKYIGETEKNLKKVFDAAEKGGGVLLFDEADALFGKRSEVKESHDRYANIEVSYLLQRMETYRGLAILTTNLKNAIDTAFLRRIRFIVQFPFPDASHRAEIWRHIFPGETPVSSLDYDRLSRLNVTGGNISNIALDAAFKAASEGKPIGMDHIRRAAQQEYAKLEKSLSSSEIGDWI